MRIYLWVFGVLFALVAVPAIFYFVLYLIRGDDALRMRARRFFDLAKLVALFGVNLGIWGHIVIALLQIWGVVR